ncbi:hypothetical protein FB1_00200 [Flavobacterium branchiophilum NBRC 15030 = ATCC 35035]|nr:hypothetical protein FB1_00200 [Flavobacterium branchiophilum NBRC 15030 = ATCC 35035]
MGKFRIEVEELAKKDFIKIYKSGDKPSIIKLEKMIKPKLRIRLRYEI